MIRVWRWTDLVTLILLGIPMTILVVREVVPMLVGMIINCVIGWQYARLVIRLRTRTRTR